MLKIVHKLLWLTLSSGLLVWADQALKGWAWQTDPVVDRINSAGGYLWLVHHANYGISLGIELPYALSVGLMVVFLLFLLWIFFRPQNLSSMMLAGLIFSIAGGLSNLIDRINFGFVRDFVFLSSWLPIFNLADILVVSGVALILWSIYRDGRS